MAIQTIDEAGNIVWHCPHTPDEADGPCGTKHEHHISHEHIQWSGAPGAKEEHHTVSLPPCHVCGARTFLKVSFSEKELKAPNMWLPWNGFWEEQLNNLEREYTAGGEPVHLQMLAGQIQQLRAMKEAGGIHTGSHAMAMRHIELAGQLKASGKHPQTREEEQQHANTITG